MLQAFARHEEQWLSFLCILYPMVQSFFVELDFFIAKTFHIWERNTTSLISEWLTREGPSSLFLLLNKSILAYVHIFSQACFSLLPYLQMVVTKWHYRLYFSIILFLYFRVPKSSKKFHCIYCFKLLKSRLFFIFKCIFRINDFRNDKNIYVGRHLVLLILIKVFLMIGGKIFGLI